MTTLVQARLELSPNDRCDACPQMALLAVLVADANRIPIGPLKMCEDHAKVHEEKLFRDTVILDVIDSRGAEDVWIEDMLQ